MDEDWLFWAKSQVQSTPIPISNTKPKLTLCINCEKTVYVDDVIQPDNVCKNCKPPPTRSYL
jgi:acetyl-CoA carboxylase beta subunit